MRFKTFRRGGVHPPENKHQTSKSPTREMSSLPLTMILPLSQHIGTPAIPLVKVGDYVETAQMIGSPSGLISSAIHSPISGTVKALKNIHLPSGTQSQAIVIERDLNSPSSKPSPVNRNWRELKKDEILEILQQHGVVGMGGAAFPSHVKLRVPRGRSCETFLVNAAECEPYISSDHRLLKEQPLDFLEGIRIAQHLLNPKRTLIGVESNKLDSVLAILKDFPEEKIEVVPLKVKYPQGAEKNLIEAVLGEEVPSEKLPIEVGVINTNISTLAAICHAVRDDIPMVERIVTVSGGAIQNPTNLRVRIGAPIRSLIEECGGFKGEPFRLICGGPMMGFPINSLDAPITKGTNSILALSKKEAHPAVETACMNCGQCVWACPMGLSPTILYKNIDCERLDVAVDMGLNDCVLCGSCVYVCPAHIPLVSAFRAARGRLRRLQNRSISN